MKQFLVFGLLVALCLCTTIAENHQWALSRKLTLRFDYAARKDSPLSSSQLKVVWNGKVVKTLRPDDYDLHEASISVTAKKGWNKIQFKSKGDSDSKGLTIDNVALQRISGCRGELKEDLITNGNFEKGHSLGKGWKIFTNGLPGWKGTLEVGHGPIYNKEWRQGTHVCELDAAGNSSPFQKIYLDSHYKVTEGPSEDEDDQDVEEDNVNQKSQLTLSFDYGARHRQPFNTDSFQIFWNEEKIKQINPQDYDINHVSIKVTAKEGKNRLRFHGIGTVLGLGVGLDNVKLTRNGHNFITNGAFEPDFNLNHGWKILYSMPGWTGYNGEGFEVGWSQIYNNKWPNTYIAQLNAKQHSSILQTITFDQDFNKV